jgi:hypothetical protein
MTYRKLANTKDFSSLSEEDRATICLLIFVDSHLNSYYNIFINTDR